MSWYGKAKKQPDQYIVRAFLPGNTKEIGKLEAYSYRHARELAQITWPEIREYIDMGYTVRYDIDVEEKKRRKELEKQRQKDLDEKVQNAWWQD